MYRGYCGICGEAGQRGVSKLLVVGVGEQPQEFFMDHVPQTLTNAWKHPFWIILLRFWTNPKDHILEK